MDSFVFDAWRVEVKPQKNNEVMHFYSLRDVERNEWIYAVGGCQVNEGRIRYDVDYRFFKAYEGYIDFEEAKTVRTKRRVHEWLDRMSHYGDDENTTFLKIKISDEHLNGVIDEALVRNFKMHVSSDSLSIKLWNGCSASLVHPTRRPEWISFLQMYKIKVGYTIFFIYLGRCDYATVIFDKNQRLSLHDNKNDLPKDTGKLEFFDSDTSIESDEDDEGAEEENEMSLISDKESVFEGSMDQIIDSDVDLYSSDDSPVPTLRLMDDWARQLDSMPSSSSHGFSAISSDADSVKSF